MDLLWQVLSVAAVIGIVLGGLLVLGFVIMWIFGYVDWMNRGSH
jgi:hypothetical protein